MHAPPHLHNVEDGFLPRRPLPAESCALLDGAGEVAALEEERDALHQHHQHAARLRRKHNNSLTDDSRIDIGFEIIVHESMEIQRDA